MKLNKSGFSLIEVLISVSIISVLFVSVFLSFSGGLKVFDRILKRDSGYRKLEALLNRVEIYLYDAFCVAGEDNVWQGGKISFLTVNSDISPDLLYCALYRKKDRLFLEFRNFKEKKVLKKIEIPNIVNLEFSYPFSESGSDQVVWKDKFFPQKMPRYVKMKIMFNDANIARSFFIPAGEICGVEKYDDI